MDQRDYQHLTELIRHYNPGLLNTKAKDDKPKNFFSPVPATFKIPEAQSTQLNRRLTAWTTVVLDTLDPSKLVATSYGNVPKLKTDGNCQSFKDIGNHHISLQERVSFFLHSFSTLPSHPSFFRPKPNFNARDIRNPYTAVLAVAYDFLEAINSQQIEYYIFLNRILRCERTNYSLDPTFHLDFIPLWVSFVTFNNPSSLKPEVDRMYKCKTPGCKKQYRQLSGLQYHNTKGGCGLSLKDFGNPKFRSSKNPFSCPFIPCRKSFSCSNGLNFHIAKYHLKKWHFNQGETISYNYACPSCPYISSDGDSLRNHILKVHPNPFHQI
ncbi:putative transcriptional regulator of ribosomal protein biogenesis [Entomophthora muscae]|uniref:Transcriptional regulator of ribosomal protein biogenesis n=2 Tax=Entomophthora muscae TaxID=34485 RepID=A0ACC2STU4_9FUNG|nr:putative transcriptional regulator of ribosomal protein biogenesis [Entomophthora muscae]KAJ9065827.1 putative transcriptional regulator of ribosomal protein biogenesis [Entomophthora muscae]